MASDINSTELCMKAVHVLQEELQAAKKSLFNNETCTVNRSVMIAQLEYLRDNLPDTVEKAAKIVSEEAAIRSETEAKRNEILEAANMQAQNTVTESNQKAQQERATQEAAACVENARAEAQRILDEAGKKALELVSEENIVRRAHVESEELRESARAEAASLHKNTLDYIDSLLAETDRKMSELINNIRLERNEIRNRR